MADLIATVRQETTALRKRIEKLASTRRELERQLKTHERIAAMLQGATKAVQTKPRPAQKKAVKAAKKSAAKKTTARKKRTRRTDWNAVLARLPSSFTAAQVKEAAGDRSSSADVHQALLRWRKARTVTSSGRGQYKKA